jgi:hypothetical protein
MLLYCTSFLTNYEKIDLRRTANGDNIEKCRDGVVGVCPDQAGSINDRHYDWINLAEIIQASRLVYRALWHIARALLPALLDKKVTMINEKAIRTNALPKYFILEL